MKYIRVARICGFNNQIFMFDHLITHVDMVNMLKCGNPNIKVVSAGFVNTSIDENGSPVLYCYGMSTGLNIYSDPEDTALLNKQLIR